MGTSREWITCIKEVPKLVEIPHNGYVVDLISSLKVRTMMITLITSQRCYVWQAMLSNPSVKHEVNNLHNSSNGTTLEDFCDGSFVKNHALFQANPHALQIIIYYDDIEVGNPLGSKSGNHKLGKYYPWLYYTLWLHNQITIGCFYFTLGNVLPIFRSQLRMIQLLAIAYTSDIRTYGYEKLLQPFLDSVKKLKVICCCCCKAINHFRNLQNGCVINIHGRIQLYMELSYVHLVIHQPATILLGLRKE